MTALEQIALRLFIFVALFAVLALSERMWPRRPADRRARWITNLGLIAFNSAMLRGLSFAFPALVIAAAFAAEHWHWGLLPALPIGEAAAIIAGFVILDLAVYGQHVAMHFVPSLWRLHRVHHADASFDLTTGVRFHPLEILLSQAWKIGVIILVGVPVAAAFAFEILLNATSMFSHSNLKLPASLDRWLRLVVVTPDMHRVHHSTERDEHDRNFGFNLSLWDRLFATYREQPRNAHETMKIGLSGVTWRDAGNLVAMLRLPFARGER